MKNETLTAQRTDPKTGIVYTFSASEPDLEAKRTSPYRTEKDFVLKFFWWVNNGDIDFEAYPLVRPQAQELLPIISWCIDKINLKPNAAPSEKGNEKYNYSYEVLFYSHPETSPDAEVPEPPSNEMMVQLGDEIINSEALHMAMFWYVDAYRPQIEADEKANETKDIPEPDKSPDEPTDKAETSTSQSKRIDPKKNIKQSIHSLTQQFYIGPSTRTANESAINWSEVFGGNVDTSINTYGIDLTEIQSRVMEGIIYALSDTNYDGNLTPLSKEDILQQYDKIPSIETLPKMYRHVKEIPRISIGKRELVRLAGMNYDNQRDVERVGQALSYLSTTQFCFYYTRMAIGKDGKPERDKKTGDILKESVTSVDTLFKVKTIKDEATQIFKHYEISPSALFLDQKEKYFMLIPFGWREEVRALVGNKKASAYLYLFLLYLRYQFEQKRRHNAKPSTKKPIQYVIKGTWVSIAQALRMPEIVYKKNPTRAKTFLDDAYSAAKQLGYLVSYNRTGITDTLVLNPSKYPSPGIDVEAD